MPQGWGLRCGARDQPAPVMLMAEVHQEGTWSRTLLLRLCARGTATGRGAAGGTGSPPRATGAYRASRQRVQPLDSLIVVDDTLHPVHEEHDLAQGCKAESGQGHGGAGRAVTASAHQGQGLAAACKVSQPNPLSPHPRIPAFLPRDERCHVPKYQPRRM